MQEFYFKGTDDYEDRQIDDNFYEECHGKVYDFAVDNDKSLVIFLDFIDQIFIPEELEVGTTFSDALAGFPDVRDIKNNMSLFQFYLTTDAEAIGYNSTDGTEDYTLVQAKFCQFFAYYVAQKSRDMNQDDVAMFVEICFKKLKYLNLNKGEDRTLGLSVLWLMSTLLTAFSDVHQKHLSWLERLCAYLAFVVKHRESMILRTLIAIHEVIGFVSNDPQIDMFFEETMPIVLKLVNHEYKYMRYFAIRIVQHFVMAAGKNGEINFYDVFDIFEAVSFFFYNYDINVDMLGGVFDLVSALSKRPLLEFRFFTEDTRIVTAVRIYLENFEDNWATRSFVRYLELMADWFDRFNYAMIEKRQILRVDDVLAMIEFVNHMMPYHKTRVLFELNRILVLYFHNYNIVSAEELRQFVTTVVQSPNFEQLKMSSVHLSNIGLLYNIASVISNKYDEYRIEELQRDREAKRQKIIDVEDDDDKDNNANVNESSKCCVCLDKEKNTGFMPCKHMVCCHSCSNNIDKCPLCRREIDQKIKFTLC